MTHILLRQQNGAWNVLKCVSGTCANRKYFFANSEFIAGYCSNLSTARDFRLVASLPFLSCNKIFGTKHGFQLILVAIMDANDASRRVNNSAITLKCCHSNSIKCLLLMHRDTWIWEFSIHLLTLNSSNMENVNLIRYNQCLSVICMLIKWKRKM